MRLSQQNQKNSMHVKCVVVVLFSLESVGISTFQAVLMVCCCVVVWCVAVVVACCG